MDVTVRAILRIFLAKSFENNDGETVEYNEAYFLVQDEEGKESVAIVNTKKDLEDDVDEPGILKISIDERGKKRLISFTPKSANRSVQD